MSECSVVTESMALLLTESLDRSHRELCHQHIESCPVCTAEWNAYRETWSVLGGLPEVEVPAGVRERFLSSIGQSESESQFANVVPFHRRTAVKWLAQAAAVVIVAGSAYFAGHRSVPLTLAEHPATIASVQPAAYSLAETRVLPASAISPVIQGRPNISNVRPIDADASDNKISLAFDVTSHVTVTGSPADKSMVALTSYLMSKQSGMSDDRSQMIEWAKQTYSQPAYASPEIADALANVMRNDQHEGVRIRAVDALKSVGPTASVETRQALIEALKHDPNPSVRMKAVDALARLAQSGAALDVEAVDTLRQKASEPDENAYIRMKAAEALSSIRPQ